MAGFGVINLDWLNANATRNYPIVDGASREAVGGRLTNGLVVDLNLPVPIGVVDPHRVFIQRVVGFSYGVVVSLATLDAPSQELASATIFTNSHEHNRSYILVGSTVILGSQGRITIGSTEALAQAAARNLDFTNVPQNSLLVPGVIRPSLRGIHGIVVQGQAGASEIVSGIVTLRAGSNIDLSANPSTGEIVVSSGLLDPGDTDAEDCGCDPNANDKPSTEGRCVKSINGIAPDENGNIDIAGVGCVAVTAQGSRLVISETCTTPCCGCDQLNVIYDAVQAVENELATISEVAQQLRGRIDNLTTAFHASSLNPPLSGSGEDSEGLTWILPLPGP